MIKYSVVKEQGLINEDILKNIPSHCDCGSELVFTDNLVNLACPNRYCYNKIGARLESMCKILGIDGWGNASCVQVAKEFKLKSPAQLYILAQRDVECKSISGFQKKLKEFKDVIDEKELLLWEYVQAMSIPGVDSNAHSIFGDYSDIKTAYIDIINGGVPFIADKLGITIKNDASVLAVNTYNTLFNYQNELETLVICFTIKETVGKDIYICITGGVEGYTNKSEFINSLKYSFADKLNIIQQKSVTSDTNILVCDAGDSDSSKFMKARNKNEKAGKEVIKICTATECFNYLSNMS